MSIESRELYVVKRNGSRERFDKDKLFKSVVKAAKPYGIGLKDIEEIVGKVLYQINRLYETSRYREINTDKIAEIVEYMLIKKGVIDPRWNDVARDYLLIRIYKESGQEKKPINDLDKMFTYQALRLLYSRYLLRDPVTNKVIETPQDMFHRVARFVAKAEEKYERSRDEVEKWERLFYELMSQHRFLPNSPTLMNAGTKVSQLAACFVVPVHDDIDSIFKAVYVAAKIQKTGAGVGFDFSELRPQGDIVETTGGTSSGPLSFMKIFDISAEVMKSGGKRRGAMMGIMHVWHPDIEDFIEAKCLDPSVFQNFNLSVAVYDSFMKRVLEEKEWFLVNPRKCKEILKAWRGRELEVFEKCKDIARRVSAKALFDKIVDCAWRIGDPGLVFIDTINKHNPTPGLGMIRSTNPCGETPLLYWEACNLGSINLSKYIYLDKNGEPHIDWEGLARDTRIAVRFLDDVIDVSNYLFPEIEKAVKATRKIGLGIMGFADMLVKLGIRYDSEDALYIADKLMEWIAYNAKLASIRLAKERGSYPAYENSRHRDGWLNFEPQVDVKQLYDVNKVSKKAREIIEERPPVNWDLVRKLIRKHGIRNATTTTIAPTGSISIIAGTSSGIEPFFALVYIRESSIGRFIEINNYLREWLVRNNMLSLENLVEIAKHGGTLSKIKWVPEEVKNLLRTALEINYEYHVKIQAAFQRWTDNAVSKTINMPYTASVNDVRGAYLLAWRLGCKGITVFRDKSRKEQVLKVDKDLKEVLEMPPSMPRPRGKITPYTLRIGKDEIRAVVEEYAGGCPSCDL